MTALVPATPPGVPGLSERDWAFLEHVALGKPLVVAAKAMGRSVPEALRYLASRADLTQAYQLALELSAFMLEDEALSVARKAAGKKTGPELRAVEIRLQQLRWSAERRNPKMFSSRGEVQMTVPIQINTTLDLGTGPKLGTKEHPNIYALEAHVRPADDGETDPGTAAPAAGEPGSGPITPEAERISECEGPGTVHPVVQRPARIGEARAEKAENVPMAEDSSWPGEIQQLDAGDNAPAPRPPPRPARSRPRKARSVKNGTRSRLQAEPGPEELH